MYEELLLSEEGLARTDNKKIFIGRPPVESFTNLQKKLDELKVIIKDEKQVKEAMKKIVTTYQEPLHHLEIEGEKVE